jgi:HlyD family secretion protein
MLLVAGSLAWAGCGGGAEKEAVPLVQVQAATAQKKTIHDVISTEAVLYARSETSIVPKISAPVEKFYVNRGSRVHTGQLVAQLENRDLQAAVEQAKGAYDQAQAAYETSTQMSVPAQVQAAELSVTETKQANDAAEMVYQSRQELYKSGAIARNLLEQAHVSYLQAHSQYEQAVTQLEGLKKVGQRAALNSAEGQLAAAKGAYQAALANLQYSEIRSPIDGVVTDRPLYEGQMASAGTPLMTVMDLSHVIGRAYISPQQAAQINVGDPASLLPGEGQADDMPAKVTVVSPALDPNSTTVQVWVEAVNPGGRLKPGATVPVNIVARTVKDALVVPAEAVLTAEDGTTSVMVIGKDQVAHQTNVKTGIRDGDNVQILSGLKAGDQVVTQGAYGLPDGTKVEITKGAAAGGGTD